MDCAISLAKSHQFGVLFSFIAIPIFAMPNFRRPPIPEHFSSLMPKETQIMLKGRKFRTASGASSLSVHSITSDFLEKKIMDNDGELEYGRRYRAGLHDAFQTAKIGKREYDAELECLNEAVTSLRWERTTINRQRKILEEDITKDLKPNQTQVEDAYAASMMECVLTGQARMPKDKLNNQEFRKAIEKYYGAKVIMDGIPKTHCSLVGWCDSSDVKASHIVPRILNSEELAHLYGVGEVVFECPIGLTFCLNETKKLTAAMKSTRVLCIKAPRRLSMIQGLPFSRSQEKIPRLSDSKREETRWQLILIDQS